MFVHLYSYGSVLMISSDAWVCSDSTPSWTFGYGSTESPHPTIKIHSWTAYLNAEQHSSIPLVFPPRFSSSNASQPAPPTPLGQNEATSLGRYSPNPTFAINADQDSIRVIGYTINSLSTGHNNGWWRITKLPSFGVEGTPIEFFAKAALWEQARYDVTVYWIGECDIECGGDTTSEVWAVMMPVSILIPMLMLMSVLILMLVFQTRRSF
jgi:hypothetical protein